MSKRKKTETGRASARNVLERRRLLQGAAAAGATFSVPHLFIPRSLAQRAQDLVVVHWGGAGGDANRKAYFEPFSKETGIRIIEETGPGMEKVKAQLDSGKVTWDVLVDIGAFRMFQGAQQDLLEKIDYSIVTNTKDLIDYAVHPYGVG